MTNRVHCFYFRDQAKGSDMRCPKCQTELTQVGSFWICPEHGQVEVAGDVATAHPASSKKAPARPSIFLSYARGDDELFVRRLYDALTARGFDVWFDRVHMPSRGLTFHQEIREPFAARNRLLLPVVVGGQVGGSAARPVKGSSKRRAGARLRDHGSKP